MHPNLTELCAALAHEANRLLCLAQGDHSQTHWEDAPAWQRESAIAGVEVALAGATPEQQHETWMAQKLTDGWTRGPVKDAARKTHPALIPYAALPPEQRAKDTLFGSVVRAMADALTEAD